VLSQNSFSKEAFFMKQAHVGMVLVLMLLCAISFEQAQQTVATNTNSAVPQLVNYSGVLTDANGKPLSGVVGPDRRLLKGSISQEPSPVDGPSP
jgi:hypothetical protein